MEKKYLFLLLLLLTVGFASVNTYLDLNGKVDMSLLESDLDVVFKEVLLNKEKSENTIIIENGKSFIYSADDLNDENKTSTIDYVVMNKSHQYDVEVIVSCTSDYEENISYNGTFDDKSLPLEKGILIEAGEVKTGNIITELLKMNTSEESLVLKCSLNYIPVSRETIVEDEEYIVTLDSGYEEKLSDIKVRYYEEYSKLPELTRSNYKFLGWYTEEDIKVDNNSLVRIKGNHTLKAKWLFVCPYEVGQTWTFGYTGGEQKISVPCDGNYKLETWGAQGGGYSSYIGGYGAYSVGVASINNVDKLYVNVGGAGLTGKFGSTGIFTNGGYNGGGSNTSMQYGYGSTGGGATHIATVSGILSKLSGAKDKVLIVSAGGGGGGQETEYIGYCYGGHAGGVSGSVGSLNPNRGTGGIVIGKVGTQTSGAGFGLGGASRSWGGGGGAGIYGGTYGCGGGGGASYIGNPLLSNKAMYCYKCTASSTESTKTVSVTCVTSNPTVNCAKQGNGYAKITYLGN